MTISNERWASGTGNGHAAATRPRRVEPLPRAESAEAERAARFGGMNLTLRKTADGRFALGVEIELGVEEAELEKVSAKSAAEEQQPFTFEGEEDALEEGAASARGLSAEALSAESEGDEEALLADDGDDEPALEDEGDDSDERELLASEAERGEQWPNRLPVPEGVAPISQAPALFEALDESEDEQQMSLRSGAPSADEEEVDGATSSAEKAAEKPASAVERMLAEARKTIGLGESPPRSNRNKVTAWYNKNIARIGNGPWCNMAVTYWAGLSGNLPAIFAGKGVGYAYTVAHAQKFNSKKRWHAGTAGIQPGDIVFFDWKGSRSIKHVDHVGVVEKVDGKKIITIEGNTSDRCKRMVRDAKFIAGYGRPAYAA